MKELYMIGNSHIDPVWFWNWEEGMQEVKATFASALERMKEYEEFRFTCSSTAYLEWIERIDPEMFEEIRERVKEGRFEIVGGWFIEPDCLLPCGEAFVRHALYGQRYLQSRFGKRCHIGFNIDSFGHHSVMPQILKKSGMDTYVFMRPRLPEAMFYWKAKDGSQVQALCVQGEYTTWFHEPTVQNIKVTLEKTPQHEKMIACYGVGDHGGGPTIENIESIRSLKHSFENTELRFATLEDFFHDYTPEEQPVLSGAFEKINQGCYSVDAEYKHLYRQAEERLKEADNLMSMVHLAGGAWMKETEKMEYLWKLLLFNEFHDTFGGTTIRSAREEAMMQMSGVCAEAGILRGIAVQKLSQQIESGSYGFPLFVINPGADDYQGVVETELEWFCQAGLKLMDDKGIEVPYQRIHTDTKVRHTTLGGRRRFLFEAEVPAFGVRVFYVAKEPARLVCNDHFEIDRPEAYVLDNGLVRAEFDPETGGLCELIELATGYNALSGTAHFCLYRDERDCWGGLQNRIYEDTGVVFTLDAIEKIESGCMRDVIRVRSHYQDTNIETHYLLEQGSDALEVRTLLRFNHPWHLMKYALPMSETAETTVETAYGTYDRANEDTTEFNMQSFLDAHQENGCGLTIANDGKYGYHMEGSEVRVTLTRSAIFAQGNSPDWYNEVETYEHTDLGEHRFSFLLRPHQAKQSTSRLYQLSSRLRSRCECLMDTVHRDAENQLCAEHSLITTDSRNVRVVLLKKAEDNEGLLIRLLETDGRDTNCRIRIRGKEYPVFIGHDAIETYLYESETLRHTNLLEEIINEEE